MKLKEFGTGGWGGGGKPVYPLRSANDKFGRNGSIGIKGFNNSKKSYLRLDARNYYWFKSSIPYQISANLYNL